MTTTRFQLNTQLTTDISLIGFRQNAVDKPQQNMHVSLRKHGTV